MHVLTKVFIVLVSMLSVLLVPLVVVYSHNEDSFKAKYEASESQKRVAQENLSAAELRHNNVVSRLETEIGSLLQDNADLDQEKTNYQVEIREFESKLINAESLKVDILGQLSVIASANEAGQQIVSSLLSETRDLRSDSVRLREQNAEFDEANRELTGHLDIAVAARRALQEEMQRMREEQIEAIAKIRDYRATFGEIGTVAATTYGGITPDRNLDTEISSVRRTDQGTYVEIEAGSTDGVKVGWIMVIHKGGKFIGNLRIERVDINKSSGIVMLEDESRSGLVQVGHEVGAKAGQD